MFSTVVTGGAGSAPLGVAANLLPVTIGNVFGGAVMMGLVYRVIYRRPPPA